MPDPAPQPPSQGPPAIHAPWRLGYLEAVDAVEKATGAPSAASFLREYWLSPAGDERNLVIARTGEGLILLNRFPYANGHLLVALGEARPRLLDYDAAQRRAFWQLVDTAADLMERTLQPQGINLGVNQGRAAGAGVPGHLHAHLVPRWAGDVNFMTVVGQVRVIPAALETMAERYRAVGAALRAGGAAGAAAAKMRKCENPDPRAK